MKLLLRGLAMFAFFPLAAPAQAPASLPSPPPTLESTSQLIGAQTDIARLRALSAQSSPDRWQILWLHQRISEKVTIASLQVDASIAQMDNEIARADEVHGYLTDRRDRAVSRANLLSIIIGGSLGATSSGLQLSSQLTKPAAAIGIGAGALSASFALAGIHAQTGKSSRFDFESDMLAQLFDRTTLPNSQFPALIWTFLNQTAPTQPDGLTRRQELIQTWIQVKRIDSLTSKKKIDRVTSRPSELLRLSIDDFEDRAAMIQDVRAKISYLKRDLAALLASLPELADPPADPPADAP